MPPNPIDAAIDAVRPSRNGTASLVAPKADPAPLKVFIGNIYGRNVEPFHWQALDALRSAKQQQDLGIRVRFQPHWNDVDVARARSVTATSFLLDTDFDVHVSIDGDILFEPWQVAQVAKQAVEYDMVGGLYITRSRAEPRPTTIFRPGETITFGADPTPKPVRWLAGGFIATHRRVFERLASELPLLHPEEPWRFAPFYAQFWIDGPRGHQIWMSEDYALCERATQAGFTPHVAPNIRLYHLGLHAHRLEDCIQRPMTEREVAVTYGWDGRFKFEAHHCTDDED
jgi:hypothetical protein